MIGNVFLLFLGVILQVNVLASHLTFQLNDSKGTQSKEKLPTLMIGELFLFIS